MAYIDWWNRTGPVTLGERFGLNEISIARNTLSPTKSYTAKAPGNIPLMAPELPEDLTPMPNIPDLLREEGVQVGEQVKDGGRIGFEDGNQASGEATASSFLKKYEAKFGEDALNEAAQFLEGKNYSELKNANTRAKIRYELKKFGSVLGAEDSKKRAANIRAKRDAKIKINLIEATQEGYFKPDEFATKNGITKEQLKKQAEQLQKSIYKKRGILTGTKSASTLEWLIPINEFKLDNTLKKLSLSGLTVFQENRTSVILYDAFGRKFEKGSTTKLNPTRDLPKYDVIKKNLHEFEVLKRAITKKYPSIKFEWDHPLSKQTIKAFMTGTAEDLSRVNILDAKLNKGFKKSLSEKYFKSLTAKDGKVDLEAKRAVEKIAKDLKLNIGNISDDVKKFERGVSSLETLNIRDEIIKSLKNQKDLSANFKSYLNNNPELFEIAGFKDTSKLGTKLTQVTDKHIQGIEKIIKYGSSFIKNLPSAEIDKIATAVGCKTKTPVKKSEGGRIGFGVGSGSMLACIDAKWEKNPKGFFSKLTGVSSAGLDKLWKYAAPYWFPSVIVATGRLEAFKDPTKPEMWWDIMLASDAVKRWGLDKVALSQLKNASWLKRADIIGKLLLKFPGDKILTQAAKVARPLIVATETLSAVKGVKNELDLVKEYASKNNIPYEKARLAYYASGAALKPRWEGDKSFKSWAFSKLTGGANLYALALEKRKDSEFQNMGTEIFEYISKYKPEPVEEEKVPEKGEIPSGLDWALNVEAQMKKKEPQKHAALDSFSDSFSMGGIASLIK